MITTTISGAKFLCHIRCAGQLMKTHAEIETLDSFVRP
jgi:hypothetical protein